MKKSNMNQILQLHLNIFLKLLKDVAAEDFS